MEAGDLDKQEREVAFAPLASPIGDKRGKNSRIIWRAPGVAVGFPLIPEHTLDGETGIGGDHGVKESSGYPRSRVVGWNARVRSRRLSRCLESGVLARIVGPDLVGSALILSDPPRILE